MRRFEFSEGASNKFWEIAVEGAAFTVRYGKIGSSGQVTAALSFDNPHAAAELRGRADELRQAGILARAAGVVVGEHQARAVFRGAAEGLGDPALRPGEALPSAGVRGGRFLRPDAAPASRPPPPVCRPCAWRSAG